MSSQGLNKWIAEWYDENEKQVMALMRDIWEHPETGLNTPYAAKATAKFAQEHGFANVELHCAEDYTNPEARPNSVVAVYGSGKPVVGIVGELDALPKLGQTDKPYRDPIDGPGHGCGHCLMAGGSVAAACALRYAMEKEGLAGTLVLVEAPAEETGDGKTYLAKAGVFNDWDLALMWHAGYDKLEFDPRISLAVFDATFHFKGTASHAAGAPWRGRSAVDAMQLMNIGCEFMREHVPFGSYIHYAIEDGGFAPNIVPDHADVHYMFRSRNGLAAAEDLFNRAWKVAQGAAMMTETTVDYTMNCVIPDLVSNIPLCKFMWEVAQNVPPLTYTDEEYTFARKLYKSIFNKEAPEDNDEVVPPKVFPFHGGPDGIHMATTDASNMSYICPTFHNMGLGMLQNAPGHHWGVTCTSGTTIGQKAGIYGYKIIAQGAYEVFKDPSILKEFWDYQKSLNLPPLKFYT